MKVSVLLTCHNRKEKTLTCLRKLFEQDTEGFVFDVFLVNDGCTDGTAEAVREEFPQIHIIQGDGTLFWNRGMCLAWEEARKNSKHDAVLWLNDDTLLFPTALKTMGEMSTEHPDSIIVATIKSTNSNTVTYGGFKNDCLVIPDGSLQTCNKFNGNCVLIPVSVSNQIGYMDPYYRHSKGDSDYAIRANQAGVKSLVAPVLGTCDRNALEPIWSKGTIVERYKKLYSPLGKNPFEIYHLKRKTSFIGAVWGFVYIHIRVLLTFVMPRNVGIKIKKFLRISQKDW